MLKTVLIQGKQIPLIKHNSVPEEHFLKVETCRKFQQYLKSFQGTNQVDLKQIQVLSVYMFGKNVGFVNLDVEAYLNGVRLPGYVFLRGEAVAILLLVNNKMVLTKQFRVPVGQFTLECPAGMMDEKENFSGVAAKEIQEECGINIKQEEMTYLQDVLISPGGSDEIIHLFSVEKVIPQKELEEITGKIHGAEGEGEQISVVLQEFSWENVLKTRDIKLICAAAAYLKDKNNIKS